MFPYMGLKGQPRGKAAVRRYAELIVALVSLKIVHRMLQETIFLEI